MRKYTLLGSIVVHATVVCVAIILPIMATHAAPQPLERIRVVLAEPTLPAAPRVRPLQPARTVSSSAVPVEEPAVIARETPLLPAGQPGIDEHAGLQLGGPAVTGAVPHTTSDEPPQPPAPKPVPLRVGGVVRPPEKLHHVNPSYPPIALSARVEGYVILEALIGEDGRAVTCGCCARPRCWTARRRTP